MVRPKRLGVILRKGLLGVTGHLEIMTFASFALPRMNESQWAYALRAFVVVFDSLRRLYFVLRLVRETFTGMGFEN
jgi:hypothetical protein